MKKITLEALKREEAFRLYKKLRSVKAVSEIDGMPSYQTLLKWKEEDEWDKRIEETQKKLEKWDSILAKLEQDSLLKDDLGQLMLLNVLLEKTLKTIIEKDLEPTSWKEALDTLKFIFDQKRLLFGRTQSRSTIEIDITQLEEKEITETLRKINTLLQEKGIPTSIENQIKQLVREKKEEEFLQEPHFLDNITIDDES